MSKQSSCGCESATGALSNDDDGRLRRVLIIVMLINFVLFAGEFGAGLWIASSALQADALDAFGDASVYALSLYAVGKSLRWRAGTALLKGVIQGLFGLAVLYEVVRRLQAETVPIAPWMAGVAVIALVLNFSCFLLLLRYRNQDLNMRSVWLCTRNDVISNVGVIVAAVAVGVTQSGIPDAVIGTVVALIFLQTSWAVIMPSWKQWRLPQTDSGSAV